MYFLYIVSHYNIYYLLLLYYENYEKKFFVYFVNQVLRHDVYLGDSNNDHLILTIYIIYI